MPLTTLKVCTDSPPSPPVPAFQLPSSLASTRSKGGGNLSGKEAIAQIFNARSVPQSPHRGHGLSPQTSGRRRSFTSQLFADASEGSMPVVVNGQAAALVLTPHASVGNGEASPVAYRETGQEESVLQPPSLSETQVQSSSLDGCCVML